MLGSCRRNWGKVGALPLIPKTHSILLTLAARLFVIWKATNTIFPPGYKFQIMQNSKHKQAYEWHKVSLYKIDGMYLRCAHGQTLFWPCSWGITVCTQRGYILSDRYRWVSHPSKHSILSPRLIRLEYWTGKWERASCSTSESL